MSQPAKNRQLRSQLQCEISKGKGDWHILADNKERIVSLNLNRKYFFTVILLFWWKKSFPHVVCQVEVILFKNSSSRPKAKISPLRGNFFSFKRCFSFYNMKVMNCCLFRYFRDYLPTLWPGPVQGPDMPLVVCLLLSHRRTTLLPSAHEVRGKVLFSQVFVCSHFGWGVPHPANG